MKDCLINVICLNPHETDSRDELRKVKKYGYCKAWTAERQCKK